MIELKNVTIEYDRPILQNASLQLLPGLVTLIRGESGSGKSTLLYRVGLICRKTDFEYYINKEKISDMNEEKKRAFQRANIGYVLQNSLLFDHYSVFENIHHSGKLNNVEIGERDAIELLEMVKLHLPLEQSILTLSGGERQRLAIACALAKNPKILILDEPTSALDKDNEILIYEIIKKLASEKKMYVVFSSHSKEAIKHADVIYEISNQRLLCKKSNKSNVNVQFSIGKKINKNFYAYYINHFKKTYKNMHLLLEGSLLVFVLILSLINVGIEKNIAENKELIDKISYNQIFITDNENNYFLNGNEMKETSISGLIKNKYKEIEEIYPVTLLSFDTYKGKCFIVPYYNENDFSDNLTYKYNNDGVYIVSNSKSSLIEFIEDKNITIFGHKFDIAGELYNGYKSAFVSTSSLFVLMDHETIMDLNPNSIVVGYTIFCENLGDLNQLTSKLKDDGYIVNNEFQKGEELNKLIDSLTKFRRYLFIGISLILIVFMTLIQNRYFILRKEELALLKVNGLTSKEIGLLVLNEIYYMSLIGYILPNVIAFGINYITQNAIYFNLLYTMIILFFIQFWVNYRINIKNIVDLSPEESFRS